MIYNEDAYYTGYYRNVRELGAIPALVFDTICGLLRDPENENGEIANSTLCDLLGITERYLRPVISKLIDAGYIEKKSGDGRGKKTVYFITKKGEQNAPFYAQKGGTKCIKKGEQNVSKRGNKTHPINKELNKELNGVGARASASATPGTTSQIELNEFEEFWRLFGCGAEWDHEKENAKKYWMQMQQDKRDKILNQLRSGRRWRTKANDNPYFYIKNFDEQLPFMNDGTPEFMTWLESCRDSKKQIVLVMYNRKPVYCLKSDLPVMERAGATYLRDFKIPNI